MSEAAAWLRTGCGCKNAFEANLPIGLWGPAASRCESTDSQPAREAALGPREWEVRFRAGRFARLV